MAETVHEHRHSHVGMYTGERWWHTHEHRHRADLDHHDPAEHRSVTPPGHDGDA